MSVVSVSHLLKTYFKDILFNIHKELCTITFKHVVIKACYYLLNCQLLYSSLYIILQYIKFSPSSVDRFYHD